MRPDQIIFVSSNRWDVMGAAAFGFRPLWVNRAQMPDEYSEQMPLRIVPDLSGLPSLDL
jgi:2-haloacid dehalogenase